MEVEYQTAIRAPGRNAFIALWFLAMHIVHIGIERIKPVTIVILVIISIINTNLVEFLCQPIIDVCISSLYLWHRSEWYRIVVSHFYHVSDFHMYYCAVSFVMKASTVEPAIGTGLFAGLMLAFVFLVNTLTTVLGFIAEYLFDQPGYVSRCAVGLSGLAFALKVHSTMRIHDRFQYARVFCWSEVVLIRILVSNVTVIPHLAGVLVGLLFLPLTLKMIENYNEKERNEDQQTSRHNTKS
ncbi:Rhomboid-related protein 4 [Lamellibrachia satsuma]|nr:Rhomboid-related protein 4 [Lamellibrachia satsuma]